jgi:hypothetical protein
VIALAGNPAARPDASHLYSHARALNDITSDNNENPFPPSCGGDHQCNAVAVRSG